MTTTPTPTPFPVYTGDPNLVTPGVLGFIAIAVIAVATVLLLIDMTRRVRRVRYRSEIRERLAEEAAVGNSDRPDRDGGPAGDERRPDGHPEPTRPADR